MSTIRVGAAQVSPSNRIPENLARVLEYIEKAAGEGVELLCFPETYLTGYRVGVLETDAPSDELGLARAMECISAKCAHLKIGAIVGTETPKSGAKPFNSAVVIDSDGQILATHHKTRLTPKDAWRIPLVAVPQRLPFEAFQWEW